MLNFNIVTLYHWSPVSRRDRIEAEGLRSGSPTTCNFDKGSICACPCPRSAYELSAGIKPGTWDLWQINIQPGDQLSIQVLPFFAGGRQEYRIDGNIPPERLWRATR